MKGREEGRDGGREGESKRERRGIRKSDSLESIFCHHL